MVQNGARSTTIGVAKSCLKTNLPIIKKHLFTKEDIALTIFCLVKYLVLLVVQ